MRNTLACDEELMQRLPLPLARLYRRAHNAKAALERHLTAFYLWEAALKLLASVAIVEYAEHPAPDPQLAERLTNLARPSLGHWWEFARRLVPVLAEQGDTPFGKVRELLLGRARDDLPRAAGLDAALRDVLQGQHGARSTVRLTELFDRLVQYRNKELGHGAAGQRPGDFYEVMGQTLLAGVAEMLGRLDVLAGRRLLHVAEVRQTGGAWLVQQYELRGESARRLEPLEVPRADTARLPEAERLYLAEPGEGPAVLRALHPLVLHDADTGELLFLNARRDRQRAEYLSYATGRVLDRPELRGEQRHLLARILQMPVEEQQAEQWAARSQAEEPPAAEAPLTGRQRGEFELLSELGQGGMGKVYRAWQPSLGRQVALKELLRRGDARSEARFSREIRALGRVEHANLVKIFTSGSEDDHWFYVMELVEGTSLSCVCEQLQRRPAATTGIDVQTWQDAVSAACQESRKAEKALSGTSPVPAPEQPTAEGPGPATGPGHVEQAVELVRQVAGAAHALHEAGIIHRDIKPGNVMVTADSSQAVLMDLGLAQLADDVDGRLTRSRQFVGTLRYASPEQVLAVRTLDRRSDVYSLGATLWELLALRPLFGATEQTPTPQLMERIQYAEPERVRKHNPQVPADLEAIVLKCLEKDPARRYESAAALAADLGRWQRGEPVTAHPQTPAYLLSKAIRRYRGRVVLAGCLLLAALLGTAVAFYRIDAARQEAEQQRGRAEEALKDVRQAQQARIKAQIDALLVADAGAVPVLLEHLGPFRKEVAPQVQEILSQDNLSAPQRLRASLLLLPEDPGVVAYLRGRLLDAEPSEILLLRQALRSYGKELRGGLWQVLEDRSAGPERRLRAACALAEFDRANAAWAGVAGDVAAALATHPPLVLGVWMEGLRPVRAALLPGLRRLYAGAEEADRRYVLATILAEYAADHVDDLADLIQQADPQQFAVLLPKLRGHAARATSLLSAALEQKLAPEWLDARPASSWPAPDPPLVQQVEDADGLVTKRFALVQTMALTDFLAVAEGLRAAGYRPVRLRPYLVGKSLRAAAVWQRDGQDWRLASGLSAAQLRATDGKWRNEGLAPVDVAAYVPGDGSAPQEERYAGLWAGTAGAKTEVRLLLGLLPAAQAQLQQAQAGFVPLTLQEVVGADGILRYNSVWRREGPLVEGTNYPGVYEWQFGMINPSSLLMDVCLTRAPAPPTGLNPYGDLLADMYFNGSNVSPALQDLSRDILLPLRRGIQAFGEGKDKEAVAELSKAITLLRILPVGYRFRALAYARLGDPDAARKDLALSAKYVAETLTALNPLNRLSNRAWHAYADLVVSAYLGEDEAAATRLEAFVAEKRQVALALYVAGRAYAQASQVVLRGPAHAKTRWQRYADRAVALLEEAMRCGLHIDGRYFLAQPDLDPLRQHPAFRALLGRLHLERRYAVVGYTSSPERVWQSACGLTPAAHLARCRKLAAAGYRPAALAVASMTDDGQLVAASIWHRPVVPEEAADALARRQSKAALALLQLGQADKVWPLLRQQLDPRLRSYLVRGFGPVGTAPGLLLDRLKQEGDASARRALILGLDGWAEEAWSPALRQAATAWLLETYQGDPDPGVHGAADWLLRRWRRGADVDRLDPGLLPKRPRGGRGWYVNGQGQTLTVVRGPVEFSMGSPGHERDRQADESQHGVRIGRSFALAAKVVTAAQFRRFDPEHFNNQRFSPPDEGPVINVTWYQAAQYCRWLSEQEGIPEDQMCFPPSSRIKPGLTLPADYLKRTGYRLPTEAEWEWACRAGTATTRYYGQDPRLLPEYVWYRDNAQGHAWPVGRLKPNDLGLFDMLGHVGQWCMDLPAERYLPLADGRPVEDWPAPETGGYRRVRGGSFLSWPSVVRCAARFQMPAGTPYTDIGFRVARTLPPK